MLREAMDVMTRRLAILEGQLANAGLVNKPSNLTTSVEVAKMETLFDRLLQRLDGQKTKDI